MYKLILSVNNLEEVMVWPSVPPDFGPEQAQRNGTYEGISGDFNTLGPMGLWSIPLSGVFPVGRRPLYMPPEAVEELVAAAEGGAFSSIFLEGEDIYLNCINDLTRQFIRELYIPMPPVRPASNSSGFSPQGDVQLRPSSRLI